MQNAKIHEVVMDFIGQRRMFTSVDVANEVKRRGTWVRNRDVGTYLRQHVQMDSNFHYIADLIDVMTLDGEVVPAYLYHPTGTDPAAYRATEQRAITPAEFDAKRPAQPAPRRSGRVIQYDTSPDAVQHAARQFGDAVSKMIQGFKWPKLRG